MAADLFVKTNVFFRGKIVLKTGVKPLVIKSL